MALVTGGHAFISYAREDKLRVDALQQRLEEAGILVWRDTASLWPGEDWRARVRDAITRDALVFIACFSNKSVAKVKGYQNEEITVAIEELRLRRPDVPWLIPVRFDDCIIPEYALGGGRLFTELHRADVFGDDCEAAMTRLVQSVVRILPQDSQGPPVIKPSGREPPPKPARERAPRPGPTSSRPARRDPDSGRNVRRDSGVVRNRKAIDPGGTAPTERGVDSHPSQGELSIAQEILNYARNDGPNLLKSRMPEFADDHYRKLMWASASADSIAATRELIEISRQHRHIQGEVCWLAVACRQYPLGTGGGVALQLANLYRRFDLEESARPLVASAAIDGEDDAVADFLSWPDSVREQIAKKSSARSTAELLRRAAKAGSAAAARELAAGDAAAIEILAEVSPVPRMPRPRPRRLLRSHSRRMSAVLARLDLMRTVLGAVATVAGLAGIGILGTAAWLFFSNLIDSTGFSAVGHEILALVLIAPGAGAAAASFWLYGLAAERRQRLALSDSVQRLSPASRSYG